VSFLIPFGLQRFVVQTIDDDDVGTGTKIFAVVIVSAGILGIGVTLLRFKVKSI